MVVVVVVMVVVLSSLSLSLSLSFLHIRNRGDLSLHSVPSFVRAYYGVFRTSSSRNVSRSIPGVHFIATHLQLPATGTYINTQEFFFPAPRKGRHSHIVPQAVLVKPTQLLLLLCLDVPCSHGPILSSQANLEHLRDNHRKALKLLASCHGFQGAEEYSGPGEAVGPPYFNNMVRGEFYFFFIFYAVRLLMYV